MQDSNAPDRVTLRVLSTRDVPLDVLRDSGTQFPPEIRLEVDEGQIYLFAAEPPSFVTILANLDLWLKIAAATGATFAGGAIAKAGSDAWDATAALRSRMKNRVVQAWSRALSRMRKRLPERTAIDLRVDAPLWNLGPRLLLRGRTDDELAFEIAAFLYHLPALRELIRVEGLDAPNVLSSPVFLTLIEDGSLRVEWIDRATDETHTRVLPLPTA